MAETRILHDSLHMCQVHTLYPFTGHSDDFKIIGVFLESVNLITRKDSRVAYLNETTFIHETTRAQLMAVHTFITKKERLPTHKSLHISTSFCYHVCSETHDIYEASLDPAYELCH